MPNPTPVQQTRAERLHQSIHNCCNVHSLECVKKEWFKGHKGRDLLRIMDALAAEAHAAKQAQREADATIADWLNCPGVGVTIRAKPLVGEPKEGG